MKVTTKKKKVLLAFGEGALNQATLKVLQDAGFQVTPLNWTRKLRLPRERYDYLIQLGKDPIALTEGTRQLLEKSKREKAEFLLISSLKVTSKTMVAREATYRESLHFAEALTIEFHKKYGVKTAILRLPTIFGPGIPAVESETLGHLISEFASEQTSLTIYGEGKDLNYYLYLTDAAEAVKISLSIKDKEGKIYFAVPSTPTSSTTIAEIFKKMGGERHEIHYHKGLTPIEEEAKLEGKSLPHFKPDTSLEEGVLQTLKTSSADEGKTPSDKERKTPSIRIPHLRRPSRDKVRLWQSSKKRVLQLAVILLLLSPLPYIGGRTLLAAYHLSQLRHQAGAFDFQAASRSAEAIRNDLTSLNQVFGMVPFFSQRTPLHDLQLLSQGGIETSTALIVLLAEGETVLTAFENLIKSYQGEATNKQTEEEFNRLTIAFKEAEEKLLTAWGYLNQTHPLLRQLIAPYLEPFQKGLPATKLGGAFAAAASDLLGYQGERSYLILFQNSAELRAGGGFLGSLAQLTLENGGIKKLEFFDSYQFDKIKGDLGVPLPAFEKFIGLEKSFLRESNFYASFPESGRRISQLFEIAQDVEVAGVIGLNLFLAKELINLTGTLELAEFERTVTADNLFEVTTEEVESEFLPGGSKKKRFLRSLGEALLNNLFALEKGGYANLARIIWKGLEEKNLLLFFEEEGFTQVLIEAGFDGRVKTTEGGFLMVIDSNYGSKANVWVERKIDYKVFNVGRAGQLGGELTVTWTHHGTEAWPSGTYKNLFRALVPKGSRLTKATLNGEDYLPETFVTEEAGKTEFAIFFSVKPQTTAILKLNYRLPPSLNLEDLSRYTLYVQKQPGTTDDPFTFTFEEPFGKRISGEGLQRVDSNLTLEKNLERDITLEIVIEVKEE